MGEGIDPTQMCQSLVDKGAQSRQLMAITHPEVLALFEDWLEELEDEIIALAKRKGLPSAETLAKELRVSKRGAIFLLSKLKREKKL